MTINKNRRRGPPELHFGLNHITLGCSTLNQSSDAAIVSHDLTATERHYNYHPNILEWYCQNIIAVSLLQEIALH